MLSGTSFALAALRLSAIEPAAPMIFARAAGTLTRSEFIEQARRLAAMLPAEPGHSVNLCEHRDQFLLAFCAAILRRHTTVLPPSRAPQAIRDAALLAAPTSYAMHDDRVDELLAAAPIRVHSVALEEPYGESVTLIAFTSGSQGAPRAHTKQWSSLVTSTRRNADRLREALTERGIGGSPTLVATVPPQHVFGIEFSVLLPLFEGFAIHAGRPLLPADVADALAEVPEPRILVTTPVHLRALIGAGIAFPRTAIVVSATAPLTASLAEAVEAAFGGRVLEIFGSTETCAIASRRTAAESIWRPHRGVVLDARADATVVKAPWLGQPTAIPDLVRTLAANRFELIGRNADMIDVAGKRGSLAELTKHLLEVPGVVDAVVFVPDGPADIVQRPVAFVVAPGLTAQRIAAALAARVDVALLPRPLRLVAALPRDANSKLPRSRLMAMLNQTAAE
jgi:acyl-coenzyme A synthetase/AMP-(fatty) acid ligase